MSTNLQEQLSYKLHQNKLFTDLLTAVNSASSSDEMFDLASEKLKKIFSSQQATLYVLDNESHEIVTRRGNATVSASNFVFHAAHSEFPYNLDASDSVLASFNASSPASTPMVNSTMLSRLVDARGRVVGVVQVSNHLSKFRYGEDDESAVASLLSPLTAVALTIERTRHLERDVEKLDDRAAKLERANDSKWLLTGVVGDVLSKVNSITSSKRTDLWLVGADTQNITLYDAGRKKTPSSNINVTSKQITAPVGTGLVGSCASSGELRLTPSPSQDLSFDAAVDALSGETPNSVLCAPIFSSLDGQVIGVLHLSGRKHAHQHTVEDVRLTEVFSSQLTSLVESLNHESNAIGSRGAPLGSSSVVLPPIDSNLTTLCETVETQVSTVVKADHVSLYLYDQETACLFGSTYSSPQSTPLTDGILGDVALTGSMANISNIHRDPKFVFEVDTQLDKGSQSALILPITVHDGLREGYVAPSSGSGLIGVLQILRCRRGNTENPFTSHDLAAVREYANGVMPTLNDWQKYRTNQEKLVAVQEQIDELLSNISDLEASIADERDAALATMSDTLNLSASSLAALVNFVSSTLAVASPGNPSLDSIESVLAEHIPKLFPKVVAARVLRLDHENQVIVVAPTATFPFSTGITGQCVKKLTVVHSDDLHNDAYFNGSVDIFQPDSVTEPLNSLFCVPLQHPGKSLAVMQAFSSEPLSLEMTKSIHTMSSFVVSLVHLVEATNKQKDR